MSFMKNEVVKNEKRISEKRNLHNYQIYFIFLYSKINTKYKQT